MQPNFLYGTYHLYGVFDRIEPDPFVFLDTFFRGAPILSPDDVVYFDEVPVDRRGATPFVHPRAESPTLRAQGYEAWLCQRKNRNDARQSLQKALW
jgi:hypothetical protein